MPDVPDDTEEDFDFRLECIRTYRLAGNDVQQRIKALALLKSVHIGDEDVKDPEDVDNHEAVVRAQEELRRSGGASS